MSRYLNHIYGKESGKDSNKKKTDEENTPGQSSQPTDKPSMTGGTKKPKNFDKWVGDDQTFGAKTSFLLTEDLPDRKSKSEKSKG